MTETTYLTHDYPENLIVTAVLSSATEFERVSFSLRNRIQGFWEAYNGSKPYIWETNTTEN